MKKLSKRAKIISAVVVGVLVIAGIGIGYTFSGMGDSDEDKVYVESVAELAGLTGVNGSQNRYTGIVEAQETYKIEKDSDTKVKDILVKVGDTIKVGQELFTYDVEQLQSDLETKNLEIQKLQNDISSNNDKIKDAEAQKATTASDGQFELTITINDAKTEIKQKEFEIMKAQKEVESLKKKIEGASEKSEVEGVVKSINNTDNGESSESTEDVSMDSTDTAFMTVLATGNYRVKAMVSEQTAYTLIEGDAVIIRSRIDEAAIWKGTINKIDKDNTVQNTSDEFSGEATTTNTATKVPVYITLENSDGLIMGQHILVEADLGQTEDQEGIWLTESYIVQDGETAYVWVSNKNDRLEKRTVTLGEYNEELAKYQITEGLTEDEYIAFPREDFEEGMATTTEMPEEMETEEVIDEEMTQTGDVESFEEDGAVETETGEGTQGDGMEDTGTDGSAQDSGEVTEETDSTEVVE